MTVSSALPLQRYPSHRPVAIAYLAVADRSSLVAAQGAARGQGQRHRAAWTTLSPGFSGQNTAGSGYEYIAWHEPVPQQPITSSVPGVDYPNRITVTNSESCYSLYAGSPRGLISTPGTAAGLQDWRAHGNHVKGRLLPGIASFWTLLNKTRQSLFQTTFW